ncbi:dATP/dGTP pyrophosphohydrolase domain-containing protein [Pseudoxanthomonas mexicana]
MDLGALGGECHAEVHMRIERNRVVFTGVLQMGGRIEVTKVWERRAGKGGGWITNRPEFIQCAEQRLGRELAEYLDSLRFPFEVANLLPRPASAVAAAARRQPPRRWPMVEVMLIMSITLAPTAGGALLYHLIRTRAHKPAPPRWPWARSPCRVAAVERWLSAGRWPMHNHMEGATRYEIPDPEVRRPGIAKPLFQFFNGKGEVVLAISPDGHVSLPKGDATEAAQVFWESVNAVGRMQLDLTAHLRRQRRWSDTTFGPGERTAGVLDHIRKELIEVEAAPHDTSEWMDVAILAFDGAMRAGATPEQVVAALKAKQDRNEARTWPDWRTMPKDQAIEHDRSGEVQP